MHRFYIGDEEKVTSNFDIPRRNVVFLKKSTTTCVLLIDELKEIKDVESRQSIISEAVKGHNPSVSNFTTATKLKYSTTDVDNRAPLQKKNNVGQVRSLYLGHCRVLKLVHVSPGRVQAKALSGTDTTRSSSSLIG